MNILGIHDGHNSTACLLRNGKIESIVSEERFTNIKNQEGFPHNSLKWILSENDLSMREIDFIAIPHLLAPFGYKDFHDEPARSKLFVMANYLLPKSIIGSPKIISPYINLFSPFRKKKLKEYAKLYGFSIDKVCQVEHHLSHGYAAIHSSGFSREATPVLVFTCDGSGDGLSSTVGIWEPVIGYKRLQATPSFHSLGELYLRITQYLGMKPTEHEYKIMGMAPYVPYKYSEKCYQTFLKYIDFDDVNGKIVNKKCYGSGLIRAFRKD